MGKSQRKIPKYITVNTFPINKNRSVQSNLNQYLKNLRAKHANLSTKECLALIHKYIARCAKVMKYIPQKIIVSTVDKLQICCQCKHWAMNSKKIVQCSQCEDYYHISYISKQNKKDFKIHKQCGTCVQVSLKRQSQQQLRKMEQEEIQDSCFKCSQTSSQLMKCLKCTNLYHKKCFGKNPIVCYQCDQELKKIVQKKSRNSYKPKIKQLTLRDSFSKFRLTHKKQNLSDLSLQSQINNKDQALLKTSSKETKQQIDESTQCTTISTGSNFKYLYPQLSKEQIQFYKKKLIYAIQSKHMQYVQDLQPQDCELYNDKQQSMDFSVMGMSPQDYRLFMKYKSQPIGPFLLQFDKEMGYDVIADADLPANMIVCEYVGDVYTHRQALKLKSNDSIMELKRGINADETLFIVPEKYTNIARFINGANKKNRNKVNVKSMRNIVMGRPVVVLFTAKPIRKGERLSYDYNAGETKSGIDTSQYK